MMPRDLSSITPDYVLQAQQRGRYGQLIGGQDTPDQSFSLWDYASDIGMAPLRAGEGFVQSLYSLSDTVLGDSLPDWDSRLLGRSSTMPGGFP